MFADRDLAVVEKNAEDLLGPWRWKESEIRRKVVKGRRLNRVLAVGNPGLRLPERVPLRRASAPLRVPEMKNPPRAVTTKPRSAPRVRAGRAEEGDCEAGATLTSIASAKEGS